MGGSSQAQIFWNIWEKFEENHGDQDNFSDFLRIKKSVELRYGSVTSNSQLESSSDQKIEFVKEEGKMEE
jgi:hypothetical protein